MNTQQSTPSTFHSPQRIGFSSFRDPVLAFEELLRIYERNTLFIRESFYRYISGENRSDQRTRACYPAIRLHVPDHQEVDSRLSYGHTTEPGLYQTTITQPQQFKSYLLEQIGLIMKNHQLPVEIGESDIPIPLHFAFTGGQYVEGVYADTIGSSLRNFFDVPDLAVMDDAIVNGTLREEPGQPGPLAPFTAPRIDYSLHRLQHYTATAPEHFQNFVLFTNYQFYVDEFIERAAQLIEDDASGYTALVEPGNHITRKGRPDPSQRLQRLPQMPAIT